MKHYKGVHIILLQNLLTLTLTFIDIHCDIHCCCQSMSMWPNQCQWMWMNILLNVIESQMLMLVNANVNILVNVIECYIIANECQSYQCQWMLKGMSIDVNVSAYQFDCQGMSMNV